MVVCLICYHFFSPNRIYDLQGQGQAFSNVSALLKAVDQDLLDMTHLSVRDWFKKNGYKDNIIDELVTAVTKCNYGQNADIHALVGRCPLVFLLYQSHTF